MKKKILICLISTGLALIVFFAGAYVGMNLVTFDVLCPLEPTPMLIQQDIASEDGIIIPKGTIIPLRSCEYADRFELKFYISPQFEGLDIYVPYVPNSDVEREDLEKGKPFQYGLSRVEKRVE